MSRKPKDPAITRPRIIRFEPRAPRRRSPLDRAGSVCRFERIAKKQTAATIPTLDVALNARAQAALISLIEELHKPR